MALEKCPECGHDVSSLADFCPHCGFPLNDYREQKRLEKEREKEQFSIKQEEFEPVVGPAAKDKSWVKQWYKKQKNAKIALGISALVFTIIMIVFFFCMQFEEPQVDAHGFQTSPKTTFVVGILNMPIALTLAGIFVSYIIIGTIVEKEYDGYTVLGYRGVFSNILIIEGVEVDRELRNFSVSGELPNGKKVIMPYKHPMEDLDIYLVDNNKTEND